jgi:hypothetical protein
MGGPAYNSETRSMRAMSEGYHTKSFTDTFVQSKVGKIHESMDPKNIRLRESRDSEIHPKTFPIYFTLDVTGSMLEIPHMLIKDGLPTMVSKMIQGGISSPAILFGAVGDSAWGDSAPLQIGQFESGDAELDMWLTRTYPEGGGGSNRGESYLWAWYFAARHTVTDAWEKRKEKGLLVTVGDEPCLEAISKTEFDAVMGKDLVDRSYTAEELLKEAQEKWNVFHIHINHRSRSADSSWKKWLDQNLIEIEDYRKIPDIVAKLALDNCHSCKETDQSISSTDIPKDEDFKITL